MSEDSLNECIVGTPDLRGVAAAEIVRRLRLAPTELVAVRECLQATPSKDCTEISFTGGPTTLEWTIEVGLPEACQLAEVDTFVDNIVADLKEAEARFGFSLPWARA